MCQNDTNRQLLHFFSFLKRHRNEYILTTDVTLLKNFRNNSFGKIFNFFSFRRNFHRPHPHGKPHRPPSIILFHHRLLAFNRISASTAAHSDVRRGRRRRAKENKGGARRRRGGGARARAVIWIPSELSSRLARPCRITPSRVCFNGTFPSMPPLRTPYK